MEQTGVVHTKWYRFDQSNSGGTFVVDEDVTHRVFIEAIDADHANAIAEKKGIYFDGCAKGMDCSCCGDRWDEVRDDKGIELPITCERYKESPLIFNTIREYAQMLVGVYDWCEPDAYIYPLQGEKIEIYSSRD